MKHIKFTNIFVYLIIGVLGYWVITPKAHADLSLGIFPPILQINATPPSNINTPFTVANEGTEPVELIIQLKPFLPKGNDGQVRFLSNKDDFPGNDALILEKIHIRDSDDNDVQGLALGPKEQQKLFLHIALPKDEPPSDYYFSILFVSKAQQVKQTSSSISGGIGTNVLLSVGPKDKTSGSILEFSAPWIVDHGPINFTLNIDNTSSHFINPRGNIIIKNMFGQTVGNLNLLPVNILANSGRLVPNADSTDGDHITWKEKFLLGLYTVTLKTSLSDEGPVFTQTRYFLAFPLQLLLALIIIIAISVIIVIRVRRKLKTTTV